MASAVDPDNLSRELERYRQAGLGGVHIIPIYGAKGFESRYVDYLSPKWMELLRLYAGRGPTPGHGRRHDHRQRLVFRRAERRTGATPRLGPWSKLTAWHRAKGWPIASTGKIVQALVAYGSGGQCIGS